MNNYKKYTIFQSYKVVALKLSLPCPFECTNSKGRGTHNFWATTLKLWKNEYILRVFKSYYYHFFIFLLDSDLEKTLLSQTSIARGVLGLSEWWWSEISNCLSDQCNVLLEGLFNAWPNTNTKQFISITKLGRFWSSNKMFENRHCLFMKICKIVIFSNKKVFAKKKEYCPIFTYSVFKD